MVALTRELQMTPLIKYLLLTIFVLMYIAHVYKVSSLQKQLNECREESEQNGLR